MRQATLTTLLLVVGIACTGNPTGISYEEPTTPWLVETLHFKDDLTVRFNSRTVLAVKANTYWKDQFVGFHSQLAERLFAIPGVVKVRISAYQLEVTRAELFGWDEIVPELALVMETAKDVGALHY